MDGIDQSIKEKESTNLKVSEGIVKLLEKLGIQVIFGIPGSQTAPFYDALYSSSIRHLLVRHEQAAAYMADAYAKITGRIGVCDGTGGPGAVNLLTGVATAWTDNIPVLALTGQQPLKSIGKGVFQELNHVGIFSPVTKWSTSISSCKRALEIVQKAYKISMSGRPGPVHIDLPLDVQNQTLDQEDLKVLKKREIASTSQKHQFQTGLTKRAARLLAKSSKPIIIAGGGVHYSARAWKELRDLAEYLEAPVCTTFNGRGSFPEDHRLSAHRMGVHAPTYNDRLLSEAEVILALGCRFASLSTRGWTNLNPKALLIQVDIDPKIIGINYPCEIGIVGDAKRVLTSLLDELKTFQSTGTEERKDWTKTLEESKESWKQGKWCNETRSEGIPLKPQKILSVIRRFFDRETVFTADAGNNKLWASTFLDIYEPLTWIQSGEFGPMGYALPAAIACKLAKPEKSIVAISGDGGFYMSMHELSTSVQENLPIIICILNDNALGTIKHCQRSLYGERFISVDFTNPEFSTVADALGCLGLSVESLGQLSSGLDEGMRAVKNGQPAVLDIKIDGDEPLPP